MLFHERHEKHEKHERREKDKQIFFVVSCVSCFSWSKRVQPIKLRASLEATPGIRARDRTPGRSRARPPRDAGATADPPPGSPTPSQRLPESLPRPPRRPRLPP